MQVQEIQFNSRAPMKNRPERSYEDKPQRDTKRTKRKPDYNDAREAKRNYD